MKTALVPGIIIAILSGAWLFIMRKMGLAFTNDSVAPVELVSVLIPIVGLYWGVRRYKRSELKGNMNFLEGLVESFKILIVAGVVVVFVGIVFINWLETKETNWSDFSGRIFAALLVGVLSALTVSLLLSNKSKKID
jgi:ABC-type dipeptide/oligopeptide/nickel transport system permease component